MVKIWHGFTFSKFADILEEREERYDRHDPEMVAYIDCGHPDPSEGFRKKEFEIVLSARNPKLVYRCCGFCFNLLLGELNRNHNVRLG